eukprot:scaffold25562_cov79-Phaeocystis_antarctica.AAC.1
MQRGAHLQHADVFPAHAAPLDQPPHRRERHGHHVLVLVARRPLAHHQALGVLAGHVVRRLELRGVDEVPVGREYNSIDLRGAPRARLLRQPSCLGAPSVVEGACWAFGQGERVDVALSPSKRPF